MNQTFDYTAWTGAKVHILSCDTDSDVHFLGQAICKTKYNTST